MLKKLLTATVLSLGATLPLLSTACSSDNSRGEYGLTGADRNDEVAYSDRQRYTDAKGHYHSEWVGQGFHN